MEGFLNLCTHPFARRYGYFSHDNNYIGRGRNCELDTHRLTGQTYDRSAFSDVGNAFLLRQCSITVHRGIDRPTIIEWITLSLRSVLRIRY